MNDADAWRHVEQQLLEHRRAVVDRLTELCHLCSSIDFPSMGLLERLSDELEALRAIEWARTASSTA